MLNLTFPGQVNLERLRKGAPQLARWWDIGESIKQRAFGTDQIFHNVTDAQEAQLHREGQSVVSELLSGRFDDGLQSDCSPGKQWQFDPEALARKPIIYPLISSSPGHARRSRGR
jgi:hypothetical protein